jgi:hypothetical protein
MAMGCAVGRQVGSTRISSTVKILDRRCVLLEQTCHELCRGSGQKFLSYYATVRLPGGMRAICGLKCGKPRISLISRIGLLSLNDAGERTSRGPQRRGHDLDSPPTREAGAQYTNRRSGRAVLPTHPSIHPFTYPFIR